MQPDASRFQRGFAALLRAFVSAAPGEPWRRVQRVNAWIRLGIIAAVFVEDLIDPGELRLHHTAFVILLSIYAPVAVIALVRRATTPLARLAYLILDLGLLFLLQVFVPETRFIVLFGYLLLQSYAGAGGGFVAGATVGGLSLALAVVGERLDSIEGFDGFALGVYATVVTANAFLIEAATREQLFRQRRRSREQLAAFSHELRNALASIQGLASTLSERWEEVDDETRRALLERINVNSAELAELTSNLLDASKQGRARPAVRTRCVLQHFVRSFVDARLPLIGDHQVTIRIHPAIEVEIDEFSLGRVLSNLLSNAAKYSPLGSVIEVAAEEAGAQVVLSVSDQGSGIPEEEQGRIFEPFYRGSGELRAPGAGLGLAVVRHHVEALGGRIWFTSSDRGTTFSFTLDRAGPAARAVG